MSADLRLVLLPRPNGTAFIMKTEDEALSFKSDKLNEEPVSVEVKLENTTGKRQTFKVVSTSNEMFKIHPRIGFIEDKAVAKIKITFQAKDVPYSEKHSIGILHMAVEDKALNRLFDVWGAEAQIEDTRVVKCTFQKLGGLRLPISALSID